MQSPLEPPRRFRPPVAQTLACAGCALANDLQWLSLSMSEPQTDDDNAAATIRETIPIALPKHGHAAMKLHCHGKRASRHGPAPAAGVDSGSDSGEESDRAPSLVMVTCLSCGGSDWEANGDDDDEVVWSEEDEGN